MRTARFQILRPPSGASAKKRFEREPFQQPCEKEDEWYTQERHFDPANWTINVGSYFPELIAQEYDLLWAKFPYQLNYLAARFEASRQLLKLEDDWDGNGGKAFVEEHWQRVIRFLSDNALWLWEREQLCIPEPQIVPGPGRSIDVHWKSNELELLLNVPEDRSLPVSFYGDDFKRETVNGTVALEHDNFWLMLWLVGRK